MCNFIFNLIFDFNLFFLFYFVSNTSFRPVGRATFCNQKVAKKFLGKQNLPTGQAGLNSCFPQTPRFKFHDLWLFFYNINKHILNRYAIGFYGFICQDLDASLVAGYRGIGF